MKDISIDSSVSKAKKHLLRKLKTHRNFNGLDLVLRDGEVGLALFFETSDSLKIVRKFEGDFFKQTGTKIYYEIGSPINKE